MTPSAPPKPMRRRRSWRRRLAFAALLFAVVTVVAALVLEAGARMFWTLPTGMEAFQADGMYRTVGQQQALRPGYRGSFSLSADEPPTVITVNSLGLRGAEPPPDAADRIQVLCAGDSLIFGYGVENEETLPARLAEQLGQRLDRAVVAANAGVPGYGSRATAASVQRLVPVLEPDAVLFGFYLGNDCQDDLQRTRVVGGLFFAGPLAHIMESSWRGQLAARSRFWLWLETWILTNKGQWSPLQAIPAQMEAARVRNGLPRRCDSGLYLDISDDQHSWTKGGPPVVTIAIDNLRASLQDARAACRDAPLVLAILPTLLHLREQAWRRRLAALQFEPGHFRFGKMRARVRQLAADLELPVVDVAEVMQRANMSPEQLFLSDGGHLSPAGNELAASAIAEVLVALLD